MKVALIFGGRSPEHNISIQSAVNIYDVLRKNKKYEIFLIKIDKKGNWYLCTDTFKYNKKINFVSLLNKCDVVFSIIHGRYGEDGSMQGLFEVLDIPYVGANILASSVCMDKDVTKRLLKADGFLVPEFLVIQKGLSKIDYNYIERKIKYPMFVKPANSGSSIGISRVDNRYGLRKAVREAFIYDSKVIIEKTIIGREVECSVIGNDFPIASLPGEVITKGDRFYSYKAKYVLRNGVDLDIPACLSKSTVKKIQKLAIEVFKVLCCEGMARVDFFIEKKSNKIYINEVNTLPGFTVISMYPKLWEVSGLSYTKLIDKLISLAIARHKLNRKLKT